MYQRKKRRPVAEINVVPYIDVMLVLLIIFTATAPLITHGVKVDLPKMEESDLVDTKDTPPIIASIDADGKYNLGLIARKEQGKGYYHAPDFIPLQPVGKQNGDDDRSSKQGGQQRQRADEIDDQ